MATEILAGPLGELRGASLYMYGSSVSAGGSPLTTTATHIHLLPKAKWLAITPRNFATAIVAQILVNPFLRILKTTDSFATPPVDLSSVAQDSDVATVVTMNDFSTLALGHSLWVGSHVQFAGVMVDIGNTNAGSNSALTVGYWAGGNIKDITATDNTSTGSKSFAQDGLVTWAVPTDWAVDSIEHIAKLLGMPMTPEPFPCKDEKLFWTRWTVDVVFDSSVTARSMLAINRATTYAELVEGQPFEQAIEVGFGGISCVQAKTNAGTANLVVNMATRRGERF